MVGDRALKQVHVVGAGREQTVRYALEVARVQSEYHAGMKVGHVLMVGCASRENHVEVARALTCVLLLGRE